MKAERTDLPENEANILFQPDMSGMSNFASTAVGGGQSEQESIQIKYETNIDVDQLKATKV